jgi:hypothetical protein
VRILRALAVATVLSSIAVPVAAADGLPVLGVDVGASGVAAPDGGSRYVTIPAPGGTMVERSRRAGGQILSATFHRGRFTVPAVAYDGSASGLSGDRHTLVLIEPRRSFPRATTSLLVLHAPSLAYRALVKLRGDFSFDAVSPNGSRLFLIQYLSPADPTRYAVRSFDLGTMRLVAAPIVDPREAGESMRGNPLSRVESRDGGMAYTLYDGGGAHPFIHALDTARATARCIDISGLELAALPRLRLHLGDGGRLVTVADGTRTLALVDTRTLSERPPSRSHAWPVSAIAAALAGATLLALVLRLRRRRPVRRPVPVD